jgi:hypothetical protein
MAGAAVAPVTRPRIPSRTAFEQALDYIRSHGLDDRGFSVSLDGTITVHAAQQLPKRKASPRSQSLSCKPGAVSGQSGQWVGDGVQTECGA